MEFPPLVDVDVFRDGFYDPVRTNICSQSFPLNLALDSPAPVPVHIQFEALKRPKEGGKGAV